MKKLIILIAFLTTTIGSAQALSNYQRHGQLTTAEINAIDTTKVLTYTADNIDLGIEVINRRDGNGWVPRITSQTLEEVLTSGNNAGGLNMTGIGSISANSATISGVLSMQLNKIQLLATPTTQTDAANKSYVDEAIASAGGTSYVPTVATITSSYNILDADKNVKTLIYDSATNDTITIPTNATTPIAVGSTFTFYQKGAGEILFAPESATVVMDTVKTSTTKPFATWQKIATNEWIVAGGLDSYVIAAPNPFPGNLYTFEDAADPNNETNTVSSTWETPDGRASWSTDADSFDGDFSIALTRLTAGTTEYGFDVPVIAGETYNISIYAKNIGSLPSIIYLRTFEGWNVQQEVTVTTTGTFNEYTLTGVATATGNARINLKLDNSSAVNDKTLLDRIVVTQAP